MKSLKAALSLIMVLAVSFCSYAPIYAVPVTDTIITVSVMSDELIDKLNSVDDTDIVDVIVWITDVDDDAVEAEVKQKTGLETNDIKDELGRETIKNYISEKRSAYAKEYRSANTTFLNSAKADCETLDVIFQSSLSPMMIVSANRQDIRKLSMNINVVSMDLFVNSTIINDSFVANQNSFATYMRDTVGATGIYTANGSTNKIKIGQLENSVPDLEGYSDYFDLSDCHSYGSEVAEYIDHATLVAAIMVGQPVMHEAKLYKGIVPDAELYSRAMLSLEDFYAAVEFLVKSETDGGCGVDIINMSANLYDYRGVYTDVSEWIDHIAFKHDVHFVVSSGNKRYNSLSVPHTAMAYNAITVGNYENKNSSETRYVQTSHSPESLQANTLNTAYFRMATDSCYETSSGYSKPDLVAEGQEVKYGTLVDSGTSFAAPQVTGIIAQLCSKYPSLLTKQSTVKAILAASAVYKIGGDTTLNGTFLYNQQGAGVVNARAAYAILQGGKYKDITLPNTTQTYSTTITVPSSYSYLRVAMSWIKKNTVASGSCSLGTSTSANYQQLADLRLQVYKGTGTSKTLVATSDLSDSNLELVQFNVDGGGTYTIVITNKDCETTAITGSQYISLAWY